MPSLKPYHCPRFVASAFAAKHQHGPRRRQRQARREAWALGRFVRLEGGQLCIEGVAERPGYMPDPRAPLTDQLDDLQRWRSRHAARQWLRRHPDAPRPLRPINLLQLVHGRRSPRELVTFIREAS